MVFKVLKLDGTSCIYLRFSCLHKNMNLKSAIE